MWLAEAKPSAAPPSCPTPLRGSASGSITAFLTRDGFAVFYPRMSFGCARTAAFSPSSLRAAASRAAAKETPSCKPLTQIRGKRTPIRAPPPRRFPASPCRPLTAEDQRVHRAGRRQKRPRRPRRSPRRTRSPTAAAARARGRRRRARRPPRVRASA